MACTILALVTLIIGVVIGVILTRQNQPSLDHAVDALAVRVSSSLGQQFGQLDHRLLTSLQHMQHVQARTTEATTAVSERVGSISEMAKQMIDQSHEITKLGTLLRPPQTRGVFGELQLDNLLSMGLPAGTWRTQYAFRSGEVVDAAIQLGDTLVPVDSKFPLPAFDCMMQTDDPTERAKHRRAFLKAVEKHVDTIATKYIHPDEGTLDFALCFLPSEGVLYELLREDNSGNSAFRHAIERRVFLVSPTTLYAYLVSVSIGLKGKRVEANARQVLDALASLRNDLIQFQSQFEILGGHLRKAHNKWEEAARHLDHFTDKLTGVTGGVDAIPAADSDSYGTVQLERQDLQSAGELDAIRSSPITQISGMHPP